jgi:hypothetical protein
MAINMVLSASGIFRFTRQSSESIVARVAHDSREFTLRGFRRVFRQLILLSIRRKTQHSNDENNLRIQNFVRNGVYLSLQTPLPIP